MVPKSVCKVRKNVQNVSSVYLLTGVRHQRFTTTQYCIPWGLFKPPLGGWLASIRYRLFSKALSGENWKEYKKGLKGKCHEIFVCWFFHQVAPPGPIRGRYPGTILIFSENSRRYSPKSVSQRCMIHHGTMTRRCILHLGIVLIR